MLFYWVQPLRPVDCGIPWRVMVIAGFVLSFMAAVVAVWGAISAHRSATASKISAFSADETLAIQQRSFLLTHRPYVAVTGVRQVSPSDGQVAFQVVITNCGLVPGRIRSHLVTLRHPSLPVPEPFQPPTTTSDIVYPGEQVHSGLSVPPGSTATIRLDYEDLQAEHSYFFEIAYAVDNYPPVIMSKDAS